MNEYKERVERIAAELRGRLSLPKGRRLVRYTHGRTGKPGEPGYFIGYQWSRVHSHHMTGMVYDAKIGEGADFERALQSARARLDKKAMARLAKELAKTAAPAGAG